MVGAGSWGNNHIKTLKRLGALSAIVDSNQDLLNKYTIEYSGIDTFRSVNDSFEKKYDGYIIATPAETHFRIAKKIIKRKIDLLVEKPLALSIQESETLVQLARENNVSLMVGHLLLFHPAIIKLRIS